jgi:hypothetical protein
MAQSLPKFKPDLLTKPTLKTPFHIDYEWWTREGRELRVYLRSYLCPEHQAIFENHPDVDEIDWIDEETAEVTRVDGLQHILRIHCSMQPGFIAAQTPLVDAIFRVFLTNNNKPLTPTELSIRVKRTPSLILKTLSGPRVYKGLRPVAKT